MSDEEIAYSTASAFMFLGGWLAASLVLIQVIIADRILIRKLTKQFENLQSDLTETEDR